MSRWLPHGTGRESSNIELEPIAEQWTEECNGQRSSMARGWNRELRADAGSGTPASHSRHGSAFDAAEVEARLMNEPLIADPAVAAAAAAAAEPPPGLPSWLREVDVGSVSTGLTPHVRFDDSGSSPSQDMDGAEPVHEARAEPPLGLSHRSKLSIALDAAGEHDEDGMGADDVDRDRPIGFHKIPDELRASRVEAAFAAADMNGERRGRGAFRASGSSGSSAGSGRGKGYEAPQVFSQVAAEWEQTVWVPEGDWEVVLSAPFGGVTGLVYPAAQSSQSAVAIDSPGYFGSPVGRLSGGHHIAAHTLPIRVCGVGALCARGVPRPALSACARSRLCRLRCCLQQPATHAARPHAQPHLLTACPLSTLSHLIPSHQALGALPPDFATYLCAGASAAATAASADMGARRLVKEAAFPYNHYHLYQHDPRYSQHGAAGQQSRRRRVPQQGSAVSPVHVQEQQGAARLPARAAVYESTQSSFAPLPAHPPPLPLPSLLCLGSLLLLSLPLALDSSHMHVTDNTLWEALGSSDQQRIQNCHVAVARALYTAVKDSCLVSAIPFQPPLPSAAQSSAPALLAPAARLRLVAFVCSLVGGERVAQRVQGCNYTHHASGRQLVTLQQLSTDVPWAHANSVPTPLSHTQQARFTAMLLAALDSLLALPPSRLAALSRLLHALDPAVVLPSLPPCGDAVGPTLLWAPGVVLNTTVAVGEKVTWLWADGLPHALTLTDLTSPQPPPWHGFGTGQLVVAAGSECASDNVGTLPAAADDSDRATAAVHLLWAAHVPLPCSLSIPGDPEVFSVSAVLLAPNTYHYHCTRTGRLMPGLLSVLPAPAASTASSSQSPSTATFSAGTASVNAADSSALTAAAAPAPSAPSAPPTAAVSAAAAVISAPLAVQCAPGCALSMLGDGLCHSACHVDACAFDGGDCACARPPRSLPAAVASAPSSCSCPLGQMRSNQGSGGVAAGTAGGVAASPLGELVAERQQVAQARYVAAQRNRLLIGLFLEQTRADGGPCRPSRFLSLFPYCANSSSRQPFGINPAFLPSSSLYDPDAAAALAAATNQSLPPLDGQSDSSIPGGSSSAVSQSDSSVPGSSASSVSQSATGGTVAPVNPTELRAFQNHSVPYGFAPVQADKAAFPVVFDVNLDSGAAAARLQYLVDGFFIDNATRTITAQMLTYNGTIFTIGLWESHLFVLTRVRFICQVGGQIAVKYEIEPVNVEVFRTEGDWVQLGVTLVYVIAVLWNLLEEAREAFSLWLHTGRVWAYFRSLWNWLDVLSLTIQFSGIIMWFIIAIQLSGPFSVQARYNIYASLGDTPFPWQVVSPPTQYLAAMSVYNQIEHIVSWRSICVALQGINVFLMTLRLLKLMDFQPRISILTRTMAAALPSLGHFLLLWAIVFVGLSVYAYALEGWPLAAAMVFWISFVAVMVFVLLNVLIAIVVDAMMEVQKESEDSPSFFLDMWRVFRSYAIRCSTRYWKPGRLQRHLLALGAEDDTKQISSLAHSIRVIKGSFSDLDSCFSFPTACPQPDLTRPRRVFRVNNRSYTADNLSRVIERRLQRCPAGSLSRRFSLLKADTERADQGPGIKPDKLTDIILAQFGEEMGSVVRGPGQGTDEEADLEVMKEEVFRIEKSTTVSAEGLAELQGEVQMQRLALRNLQRQLTNRDLRRASQPFRTDSIASATRIPAARRQFTFGAMARSLLAMLVCLTLATSALARTYDRPHLHRMHARRGLRHVRDPAAGSRRLLSSAFGDESSSTNPNADYIGFDDFVSGPVSPASAQLKALLAIKAAWKSSFYAASTWQEGSTDTSAWEGLEIDDSGNVVSMRLVSAGVEGPLPVAFAALTALTSLDLRQNKLTGEVPRGVFSKMPYLKEFYVADNNLSGLFPWRQFFGQANSPLQMFEIDGNAFIGGVPNTLFQNAPNLQAFTASGNKFTGQMPTGLSGCPLLSVIDLSDNQLTGAIPAAFGQMDGLEVFDVSNNLLTGYLPATFGFSTTIMNLDVSNNKLSGFLPASLANLGQSLRAFKVANNYFTGVLPKFPNLGRGCGPKGSDAVSCYRFSSVIDLSNNYFYGKDEMTIQAANWTGTPKTDVICPGKDFPNDISVQGNCLVSTATCTAKSQRAAAQCTAFCGTGAGSPQCGGGGVCIWDAAGGKAGCRCKEGFVASADVIAANLFTLSSSSRPIIEPASQASYREELKDAIAALLKIHGFSKYALETLAPALSTGPNDLFRQNLTILAPSSAALVQVSDDAFNAHDSVRISEFTVLATRMTYSEILAHPDDQPLPTLEGSPLSKVTVMKADGTPDYVVFVQPEGAVAAGPRATLVAADVYLGPTLAIHGIDSVLFPPLGRG
ncbi:unnamed protein product [Closterium sp. Yama58-4]|nr:unnamed protein product [Closterium sp. Yama58-4]